MEFSLSFIAILLLIISTHLAEVNKRVHDAVDDNKCNLSELIFALTSVSAVSSVIVRLVVGNA
jgi:uncharacterized protein (UPF0333 family)